MDAIIQHDPVFSSTLTHPLLNPSEYNDKKTELEASKRTDVEKYNKSLKYALEKNRKLLSATISQMRKNLILCSTGRTKQREYSAGYQPYEPLKNTHRELLSLQRKKKKVDAGNSEYVPFKRNDEYDDFSTYNATGHNNDEVSGGKIRKVSDLNARGVSNSKIAPDIRSDTSLIIPDVAKKNQRRNVVRKKQQQKNTLAPNVHNNHRGDITVQSDTSLVIPDEVVRKNQRRVVVLKNQQPTDTHAHVVHNNHRGDITVQSDTSLVIPDEVVRTHDATYQSNSHRRRNTVLKKQHKRRNNTEGNATAVYSSKARKSAFIRDSRLQHARGTSLLLTF
jgi:hypothetical protein